MSEREIREAIRRARDDLELKARAEAKRRGRRLVFPLVLGTGLFVVNCDDETVAPEDPAYGVPTGSFTGTQTGTGSGTSTGTGTAVGGGGTGGDGAVGGSGGAEGGAGGAAGAGGAGGAGGG